MWIEEIPTKDGSYWFVGKIGYWDYFTPIILRVVYGRLDLGNFVSSIGDDAVGFFLSAELPVGP